jgi:stearoyl-CoA desaturase (delta-9 desaturase)
MWFTVVAMYNAGDAVNSVTHRWGGTDFQTSDKSRNQFWVAMFSLGEGWHNSHHAFPSSARHGLAPGQLDLSWLFIRLLRRLKIASSVRQPNPKELNKRRLVA